MKVRDLIKDKGFDLIAVDLAMSVTQAIAKMVERNIGALLIMEGGRPAGMFTERDALKCYARRSVEGTAVGEVMTRNLIIASPDDDVSYVSQIMIQKGIRHMPVIEGGHVVSVLSMRDVVKAQVSNLEAEVHYLKDFITETG